jgi:3D (Asp-Asp-Asp) domain-containing protein
MIATAHSIEGETAQGTRSRPGTVAADPAVLPLGSRIRLTGAGKYSGEYSVEDTGRKVDGNHIDIYLRSNAEAKRFGRKRVTVTVIRFGDNERKEQARGVRPHP